MKDYRKNKPQAIYSKKQTVLKGFGKYIQWTFQDRLSYPPLRVNLREYLCGEGSEWADQSNIQAQGRWGGGRRSTFGFNGSSWLTESCPLMLQRAMLYNYFHNILINLNIKLTWSHSSSFFSDCSYYEKLCSNLIVPVMKTLCLDRNHLEPVYTYLLCWLLVHMVLSPWRGHENSVSSVPLIIPTTLPRTCSNFTFLNISSQTFVECFKWGHISAYTATVIQFFSYSLGSHLGFFNNCFTLMLYRILSGFLFKSDVWLSST